MGEGRVVFVYSCGIRGRSFARDLLLTKLVRGKVEVTVHEYGNEYTNDDVQSVNVHKYTNEGLVMSKLVVDATGNDLTYRIIGAAMAVHNRLGPGYKEEVYEKAMEVELNQSSLEVQCQVPVPVEYAGEQVAIFYLDLLVESQVVVEIKALSHLLTNDELAQVINYLKASGSPVGLLLNFGRRRLEYKRVFPSKDSGSPVRRTGRDHALRK